MPRLFFFLLVNEEPEPLLYSDTDAVLPLCSNPQNAQLRRNVLVRDACRMVGRKSIQNHVYVGR
jgi:hypothetical protein